MDPTTLLSYRPTVWWSSPTTTLAGFGEKRIVDPGRGADRFHRARELAAKEEVVFASFSFTEDGHSVLVIPETVVELVNDEVIRHGSGGPSFDDSLSLPPAASDRPRFAGSSLPDHLWLEAVARAIEAIESGALEKVVLARDHALWSKQPFEAHAILARLHQSFPQCYLFLVEGLVGASPELLIRKRADHFESVVLAGTVGRSDDPAADSALAHTLLTSPKTRAEHRLAAEPVAATLEQVSSNLVYPDTPDLLVLPNLTHLATSFAGSLNRPYHVLELVALLHPTPAVGGVSTKAAMELIGQLEGMDRNRYAGPVGFFRSSGDGEFAIALRCAELSGARARLFAGNGIVSGSVPEDELEETRLKLRAMLSALE